MFVTLRKVQPIEVGPKYVPSMHAWHVLDDGADVICEYTLTEGALRNRYARLPGASDKAKRGRLHLLLPDGQWVDTELTQVQMFRWRGWGHYYQQHHVKPGDTVRFVALGRRRYRVCFET